MPQYRKIDQYYRKIDPFRPGENVRNVVFPALREVRGLASACTDELTPWGRW